jgi:hypothetical protein
MRSEKPKVEPMTDITPLPEATAAALIRWTWNRGGTAIVVRLDEQALVVHSSVAYPPGAPLVATSAEGQVFEMKVRSCRKLPTESFEVSGKLVNATRPVRELLWSAVARASGQP